MFVLCLVVLVGRIIDVSLATIRTIMTVRGKPVVASGIGFCEIFIWFMVVREALNTDTKSIFIAISYALGYATGTFIGGMFVKLFIRSDVTINVVTKPNIELFNALKEKGFGVTIVDAYGINSGDKKCMLFIEVDSKFVTDVRETIKLYDDKAFIVVDEAKTHYNGYFKQDKK